MTEEGSTFHEALAEASGDFKSLLAESKQAAN